MKTLLYPQRQRCKACRNFFGALAVKGEFCTYECAGVASPSKISPALWPRYHTLGYTRFPPREKKYYLSEAEATEAAERFGKNAYQCDFCWHWHIGTSRSEKK